MAVSIFSQKSVSAAVEQAVGNEDDRKKLHECIYFGTNISQQWQFMLSSVEETAHNFFTGVPQLGDQILLYYQNTIDKRAFGWQTETVSYPPSNGNQLQKAMVSAIAVMDKMKNGNWGVATIIGGGIGAHFVDIKLTSQWFKGQSFMVVIIGRYCQDQDKDCDGGKKTKLNGLP